jgi:AraC-like DNA-binding protein
MAQPPVSRLLQATELVRVGTFAVRPEDPRFADAGQVLRHVLVFPRTSVWIERPGQRPFLADPTRVTYYNAGEPYRRRPASAAGDRCEFFALAPSLLLELLARHDAGVDSRPEQPFPFAHGPSDAQSYRLQRLAVRLAMQDASAALRVEELVLAAADRVLGLALGGQRAQPADPPRREARELAERVQSLLADHYCEGWQLADIARRVGSSPYHLCRSFKHATGSSLARYRNQLRLRAALERVAEPRADLARVAVDLGFASHSHFTTAFRNTFGETPSAFRTAASGRRLREARRSLTSPPRGPR